MSQDSRQKVALKRIYRRREETDRSDLPLLSVYRDFGVVERAGRDDNHNRPGEDLNAYRVVYPGDLVLNKMKTWQGSLGVSPYHGIVSPAYFVCHQIGVGDPRFLHHLLRSRHMIDKYAAHSKGVRPSQWDLPWDDFASFEVSLPSLMEQKAIADFLDRETNRIDGIIEKKEKMLEILVEHEGSMIKETVFSGVELGLSAVNPRLAGQISLPHGWRVAPLNSLCTFQSGKAHEPFEAEDGEFICANSRFVSTEGESVKRCDKNLSPAKPSDILMVMSDLPNGRALAKAFFVEDENKYAVNQRVCIIRAHGIDPKYAFYQLNRNPYFLSHDDGSNQTHLSNSCFVHFTMLVPPLEEQKKIVKYLDEMTLRRRSISGAVSKQIVLLSEYRQALITAAVTGEIKIPEVAA